MLQVRRLARFVDQAFRSDASWFSNRAPLQCDTGSHHTHAAEFNFHEPVTDLRHRSHSPSADIVHKPDDMKYYNNSLQAGPPVIHIIQKVIYKYVCRPNTYLCMTFCAKAVSAN